MKYRLRTLLILMAILPPMLAGGWMVWKHQILMPRQRRLEQLKAVRAALKAQIAELQASQNARVLQLQRLNAARAELKAQIAELQSSPGTRELKLQQLEEEFGENSQEYYELVSHLLLLERLRSNGFPGQAGPGILFLGPERVQSNEFY